MGIYRLNGGYAGARKPTVDECWGSARLPHLPTFYVWADWRQAFAQYCHGARAALADWSLSSAGATFHLREGYLHDLARPAGLECQLVS